MRLEQIIAEHWVDLDLLPEEPLVLDAGCRTRHSDGNPETYDFCGEILRLRPGALIIGVDPGPDVEVSDPRVTLLRGALMETDAQHVWLRMASFCSTVSLSPQPGLVEVPVIYIREILARFGPHFDLVKLDVEGAEFGILEKWPSRCATQVSVEFHDSMSGLSPDWYARAFSGPLRDYDVVKDEVYNAEHHALLVLRP